MNTDLTTSARTDTAEIRGAEVKDITRAIIAGDMNIGELIAANILASRAIAPMRQVVSAWYQLQEVRAAFTRIVMSTIYFWTSWNSPISRPNCLRVLT